MTPAHPGGRPDQARIDHRPVPLVAVKDRPVLCPTSKFIRVATGVVTVGSADTLYETVAVLEVALFASVTFTLTVPDPAPVGRQAIVLEVDAVHSRAFGALHE